MSANTPPEEADSGEDHPSEVLGEESNDPSGQLPDVAVALPQDGLEEVGHDQGWFDAFPGQAAPIIDDPEDGLPRPDDAGSNEMIPLPPLSPESLVCLGDDSEYVEVLEGEFTQEETALLNSVRPRAMGWNGGFDPAFAQDTFESACVPGNSLGASAYNEPKTPDFADLLRYQAPLGYSDLVIRSRFDASTGQPTERRRFAPDHTLERFGLRWGLSKCEMQQKASDRNAPYVPRGRQATILVSLNGQDTAVTGPVIDAEDRTPPGLPVCLVRPKREVCKHFSALLSMSDNIVLNNKPAKPLAMYCDAYRTVGGAKLSVNETAIVSCSLRSPKDEVSDRLVQDRISLKVAQGKERTFLPMFKDSGQGPAVDWAALEKAQFPKGDAIYFTIPGALRPGVPSDQPGGLFITTPGRDTYEPTAKDMRHIVLCDAAWQPPEEYFHRPVEGQERPWGTGGTGQTLLRVPIDAPSYTSEDDAATWPSFRNPMLPTAMMRSAAACADALRQGASVCLVAASPRAQGALFASLVWANLKGISGLDALGDLEKRSQSELCTNLSHRVFLRNVK